MRLLITLLILFVPGLFYAQQTDAIQFEETTHDFGTIKEEDGPAVYEFKFINNSPDTLLIKHVKASCGCTTPAWSREPVAPGESGYIKAQYNTRNRPGNFNKSLTITTSLIENAVKRLYIKGKVTPRTKTIEEELPTLLGGIRIKHTTVNLGRVYTKEQATVKSFEVYNNTDSVITFTDKVEKPAYIEIDFSPKILAPKTKGEFTITYDGKSRNDFGFVSDNVVFFTDETATFNRKSITVYATIQEYFPPMSAAEYTQAPNLVIENPLDDFGQIKVGEKATSTFVLTNKGKQELNIRTVKSTCTCTTTKLKKENIKPGDSTELEVIFNSEGRRGNQQKSVTVFSNDPKKPMLRVTVKGTVTTE